MAQRSQLIVRAGWVALVLALLVLVLAALYLAADAEGLGPGFAGYYPYVFVAAALALLLLAGAIVQRALWLRRQLRQGVPGARLSRRLLLLLLVLALPPILLVYGFGLRFIAATVDTWLRANSAEAMSQALDLGRLYLEQRIELARGEVADIARQLDGIDEARLNDALEAALDRGNAVQLSLFDNDGRLRALATADPALLQAQAPDEEARLALQRSGHFAAAETDGVNLRLRVVQRLVGGAGRERWLQGLYPLPPTYSKGLQAVESAAAGVLQANFLRDSLKLAFALILTFVLLLSVLLALLLAFSLARRLVAPIGRLAAATRAVADGRFDARLPEDQDDELGFLVRSFNRMLRELELTTARARSSAEETERQRAFLETVLARLSNGVVVIGVESELRSANPAASALLGDALARQFGLPLAECRRQLPQAQPLFDVLLQKLREGSREFREEVVLPRDDGPQLLLLRGARLPDGGLVAVFDDTSALDRARRDAAWGEVARRLAHEVKNPLTPIQLAAERLRRRVLPRLADDDAQVLDRATHTIVAQVEALKTMVNAFSDYARAPQLTRQRVDLNALVGEVVELYRGDDAGRLDAQLAPDLPLLEADSGRLRQVLHNLIKNAQEACDPARVRIEVGTAWSQERDRRWVELWVADNGPGLPPGFDEGWFEPYRSTKPKGTGLGLAVVRKIAEEHGGQVAASNLPQGGARFALRLPA